jgi:hypothetical protein
MSAYMLFIREETRIRPANGTQDVGRNYRSQLTTAKNPLGAAQF